METFNQRWATNVFNQNHPAYKLEDMWGAILEDIRKIRAAVGEISGFDVGFIKRQLYVNMFFKGGHEASSDYATIAYSPHERLDRYSGLSKEFSAFASSGLATTANMTFDDYLDLPIWLTKWVVETWLPLSRSAGGTDSAEKDMDALMKEAMQDRKPFGK